MFLALSIALGCGSKAPPVAPEAPPVPAQVAPPPAISPPAAALPAWDDVPSGRPPGGTDRPIPILVVTPDHRCFKRWISPMARPMPGVVRGDHVEETLLAPTPEVQCPEPRATDVLTAWKPQP
jgi:hypothetical protein